MGQGEGHGVDPMEIRRVQFMLHTRFSQGLNPQMTGERRQNGIKNGNTRRLHLGASILENPTQRFIDQRKHHDTGIFRDIRQNFFNLRLGAD